MQLSTRLSAIAGFVTKGSRVIDVGTDHAYIPIYLMENEIAVTCLATDINKGPLEKAEKNIRMHQIKNINLKQTNGLQGINVGEGNVIMISGMGGYLIIDILSNNLPLVQSCDKLILQPQQDIKEVRKYLHHIGFKIQDEEFVIDDGKYYTIIEAVRGEEKYEDEYAYTYGLCLINKKHPLLKQWIKAKIDKQTMIYKNINEETSLTSRNRKKELEEELQQLKKVIECLD